WHREPCVLFSLSAHMVGEHTIKTFSRFYFTGSPDSLPSFLNALMADVTDQTREADLYAPTGTRNYWQPGAIDYVQGSDHDVLLGLGVPATMLGHDPDWTHHTSEDKLDKTDASEFRRTGTLAAAAAWFMAAASNDDWRRLWLSMVASLQSERLARAQHLLSDANAQRAHARYDLNTSEIGQLSESFAAEFQSGRANPDAQRYQA